MAAGAGRSGGVLELLEGSFFLKKSLSGGDPLVPAPLQTLERIWLVMMRCSPSRFQVAPHWMHRTLSPFCERE